MPHADWGASDFEGQLLFSFEHNDKNKRLALLPVTQSSCPVTAAGPMGTASVVQLPVSGRSRAGGVPATGGASQLTVRERQVLELLVRGLSSKCIAHELVISPRTVEVHRANLMRKMGVRNIAALVRTVFEAA